MKTDLVEKRCIHCARAITRSTSSRDHIPSKFLLVHPYPDNIETIRVCTECNRSFAQDEEYMAAFLGTLLWNGDEPKSQLERILESNWVLQDDLDDSLFIVTSDAKQRIALEPDEQRLRRVVSKNAVGHMFLALGVAPRPSKISICVLENLPYAVREGLYGLSTGWITVQEGAYRYQLVDQGALVVRSVIHEFLATETIWPSPIGHSAGY